MTDNSEKLRRVWAMTMADKIVAMRDGVVEQVGASLRLCDRPCNLFVAAGRCPPMSLASR